MIILTAQSGGCHKVEAAVTGMNHKGWNACMDTYKRCTYSIDRSSESRADVSFFLNGTLYDRETVIKDNLGTWNVVQ